MNKLDKIYNYVKIFLGITLVVIGIYSEISILQELSNNDVRFIDGEIAYSTNPEINRIFKDFTGNVTETVPLNENFHILIGLGIIAGAILLSTTKISAEKPAII